MERAWGGFSVQSFKKREMLNFAIKPHNPKTSQKTQPTMQNAMISML